MLTRAITYSLACRDVETTLYGTNGGEITLIDTEPSHAAIIKAVREAPNKGRATWQSEQVDILGVEFIEF